MKTHLTLVLLFFAAITASAQTTAFTYQGHLMDAGASANGNYDIQFTLKTALTAGATVGTAQAVSPVTAVNGIFTVTLDFGSSPFDGNDRWVELGVRPAGSAAAYTVLAPRQQLTATPYAVRALSATNLTGSVTAGNIAAGTITGAMINTGTAISAGSVTAATLTGNVTGNVSGSAGSFTGPLAGDVTGTQGATVVASVGGVTAASVAAGANLANAATTASTPNTIVKRDASGNFSVGTITATAFIGDGSPASVIPVLGMVGIKPGTFVMGSRASESGRGSDEGPQMVVTLTKGFWMGAHEVTQAEYQTVTGANPSFFTGDTNRPVEMVTWNNATSYCATLTTTERAAGKIPAGWSYRLPTEAEWEYCCRAGARTTRFSYGDDLSGAALANYAWYSFNSGNTTHTVEQKQANPWGLSDMHGNVWEWCQDYYGTYPGGSVTDPQGAVSGSDRVIRSGTWQFIADNSRCANRNVFDPASADTDIGFRVVLSPVQP